VVVPDNRQEGAMRTLAAIGVAAGTLLALSCTSVSPVAINAGDQCFRCRRAIVERAMAAELMDGNRMATKFRAPGCMAKYLADHPNETGTLFVTDYATGKWIRPQRAQFVPVLLNRDTGESDYRAFYNKTDADAAASELHSRPVDWQTVMERASAVAGAVRTAQVVR
jgi:hypothetical protein